MKVGNALVASQKQAAPDHRANAAQYDLELVNANISGPGMQPLIVPPPITCRKPFFPNSLRAD